MFPQHFIIEGKHLGTGQRKLKQVHEDKVIPWSYAFFCPTCARVWALCPVERAPGTPTEFTSLPVACSRHPQTRSFEPSGSLHLEWDRDFVASFPDDVVRWQFDRYLQTLPE